MNKKHNDYFIAASIELLLRRGLSPELLELLNEKLKKKCKSNKKIIFLCVNSIQPVR